MDGSASCFHRHRHISRSPTAALETKPLFRHAGVAVFLAVWEVTRHLGRVTLPSTGQRSTWLPKGMLFTFRGRYACYNNLLLETFGIAFLARIRKKCINSISLRCLYKGICMFGTRYTSARNPLAWHLSSKKNNIGPFHNFLLPAPLAMNRLSSLLLDYWERGR